MMNIHENLLKDLREILGDKWVVSKQEFIDSYLYDETPEPMKPSVAGYYILVKPYSAEEISSVLFIANNFKIPVFPIGGKTGLVGGCVPTRSGIILSLERMKKIEIDCENLVAEVEAGATLGDLIKATDSANLSFPLHPGDEGAQIGGLIATNAGGVRAVRYGVMRNYVKGIELVLPNGEPVKLGGKLMKNNVGYDLMQLIIGSEGTLCIITKAIIKLYPKSEFTATLVVPFYSRYDAIVSVQKILRSGTLPLAIEYVELNQVKRSAEHLNEEWPVLSGDAQLIVVLSGTSEEDLLLMCEAVSKVCEEGNGGEAVIAETRTDQDKILRIRSNIYTTLKPQIIDILDVTVPPSSLGDLMDAVDQIEAKYKIQLPVYGHAGDGNLHVHILRKNGKDANWIKQVKNEVYNAGACLGGVLTGEHGIGSIRTEELTRFLDHEQLRIMRGIKTLFDPLNILNPGKVICMEQDKDSLLFPDQL